MSENRVETAAPAFHGYAPALSASERDSFRPPITIALSRETGSRGRAVARRVADLLGWQCIDKEAMECIAHNSGILPDSETPADAEMESWIAARLAELTDEGPLRDHPDLEPMTRLTLRIAVGGRSVILGRGAGYMLPAESRLHVRLVAPEEDRIAYIAQVERLSRSEAERYVRQRDEARRRFMTAKFGANPLAFSDYDMVLNAAQLGVEACAQLILAALRAKEAYAAQWRPSTDHDEHA